eukprot:TRINITY_DN10206_c0_g2_i3.p1 TRINITY_DN10206_c0_g2~~TRINITY_DN10206_c0_g2_i3.p1  ORF type:complete len:286 (-),score=47.78 TRINITY_DN10206_c0_g2_i3:671-1528(-)
MGNQVTGSKSNQMLLEDGVFTSETQLYLQRYLNCFGPSDLRVNEDGSFGLQSRKELQRFLRYKGFGDLYADGSMGDKSTAAWKQFLRNNAPSRDLSGEWDGTNCIIALQIILNNWRRNPTSSPNCTVSGSGNSRGSKPQEKLYVNGSFDSKTQLYFQKYLNHFGPPHLKVNEDSDFGTQSKKELQRYLSFLGFSDLVADGNMGDKSTNAWRSWLIFTAPSCDIQAQGSWNNRDAIIALQLILNGWIETPLHTESLTKVESAMYRWDLQIPGHSHLMLIPMMDLVS